MAMVQARFEVAGFPELTVLLTREGEGYKVASLDDSPDSLFRSSDEGLAKRAFSVRVEHALMRFVTY